MYKILLFTFLTTILTATNPKPYAVLGDVIYDNSQNIYKLHEIIQCHIPKKEILEYIKEVNATKQYGFALEEGKSSDKKSYLNKLRALSKRNDNYVRTVNSSYRKSMKKKNYELFSALVNSGLLDIQSNKDEIISYFYKNSDDINSSGVIDDLLVKNTKIRAEKEALKKRNKSHKDQELEKIKRIRENDRLAKAKMEKELQTSVDNKKLKIREEQEKELSY